MELDKFYTKKEIAKELISYLDVTKYDKIIEPSAGNGSFSKQIKNITAFHIMPEDNSIEKMDFFCFNSDKGNILTIGNPPFGRNASMAIKFFNHAAEYSKTISFIVPLSFRKESIQKKLNPYFVLLKDIDIPADSFTCMGKDYPVPCCFQIWERTETERTYIKEPNVDFDFCKADEADLAIRRVGGKSGYVTEDVNFVSPSSFYYIKCKNAKKVKKILSMIKWKFNNTVGPRSISHKEIKIEYLKAKYIMEI